MEWYELIYIYSSQMCRDFSVFRLVKAVSYRRKEVDSYILQSAVLLSDSESSRMCLLLIHSIT